MVTEQVTECDTAEFLAKSSDHLPIKTILSFTPNVAEVQEGWKYKEADRKAFREALRMEINYRSGSLLCAVPDTGPGVLPAFQIRTPASHSPEAEENPKDEAGLERPMHKTHQESEAS
ncbi:MAG: hypothetical protein Q9167_007959 [Letrouitia subvulpina]